MSNSPVHNSPILRRLRANSGYVGKGPMGAAAAGVKEDATVTSPMATRLSEDDSRWRPRSFDSFFQDVPMTETGSLLEDFDHLRPPFNQPDTTSSSSSSSTTSPCSLLSASAPHYTRNHQRGGAPEDAKLTPRQLFDGHHHHQQHQHQQQNQLQLPVVDGSATSASNSDSDSNESNLFNSYNAFNNAYASPLSFSASTVPVRGGGGNGGSGSHTDRGHGGGGGGGQLGQQQGGARVNRSSPPRTIRGEPIPLAKSFSDGEIEMNGKAAQERSSSQSPLRLLAARNNLETPATQRSSAAAALLVDVDGDVDLADYDSEMGSSDYESEEEEVARGLSQFGLGRSASVSAASGVSFMRKRVVWQRSRSLSGKTSGYPRSGSSSGSSSLGSSSSSSYRRLGMPAWFYLLLLVEVAALFYVGYVFRSSYSAISLNEFEGFISEYPKAEEAHLSWRDNAIATCTEYLEWLKQHEQGLERQVEARRYASPDLHSPNSALLQILRRRGHFHAAGQF